MTNDSSTLFLSEATKSKTMKSPRLSTISFVRQFARACSGLNPLNAGSIVIN